MWFGRWEEDAFHDFFRVGGRGQENFGYQGVLYICFGWVDQEHCSNVERSRVRWLPNSLPV